MMLAEFMCLATVSNKYPFDEYFDSTRCCFLGTKVEGSIEIIAALKPTSRAQKTGKNLGSRS